ncbi:DMT family transporter [Fodinicurvata fenggangensis]|uniref:DMT family transporter n=1 Tax=Fodinicurvata fenggangensis TaxID=1121830 RepID=UPI00068D3CAF|nr:DMT family transporter [Fodinicurvata fenggangensis]
MPPLRPLAATPVLEVGLVICWSSGFIGGTLASATTSIYLVLFWRFLLISLLLLPLAGRGIARMAPRELALQALLGTFAMFGYLATLITAIDQGVPAGTAALIAALQPLATAALAGLVLSESVSARQWLGLLVGFGGVALAVGGGLDQAPLWGYGLTLLSMASIVTATLIARRQARPSPLLPSLSVQSAVAALLFLPLALLDGTLVPEATGSFVYAILWFILFSTLGGYGFYWACLARTSATRVSSLIYLTPPVTTLWAFVMFGQAITPGAVAGFLVCLAGVWLAKARRSTATLPTTTCSGS